MRYSGITDAFRTTIGIDAVERLVAAFAGSAVILIAGEQLTGKSATAAAVAERLHGSAASSGAIVRAMAKSSGISVEAMGRRLAADPAADVRIDYLGASSVATGEIAVFESRLAGHLGAVLRDLGRRNLRTVYLACSARERALRFVSRALSASVREVVDPLLLVDPGADFTECMIALETLDLRVLRPAIAAMRRAASRDAEDLARLQRIYGFDYRDPAAFDLVVDNTLRSIESTTAVVLAARDRGLPPRA